MQRITATTVHDKRHIHMKALLFNMLMGIGFFSSSGTQANELPDLGPSSAAFLSPQQEKALGSSIMKELNAARIISHDMVVSDYLKGLGYRLIATQKTDPAGFTFFAVMDKTINAFALPGGYVGINTGLITAADSESELAGVMAHEIGHVQQHHIARMYEHMGQVRLSTIAGAVAAMILATQSSQAAQGALAATLAGGQQTLINFTRAHEKEADHVGIEALNMAGFDPMGMPAFFHRMYQNTRFYGNHIPEYLMTHPLTESRLMAAQARAKAFPYRQVSDSLQFHLIQARVQVESFASYAEAQSFFEKRLAQGQYRHRASVLYGLVLTLNKQNQPNKAMPLIQALLKAHPDNVLFQLAEVDAHLILHDDTQAIALLERALLNHPDNALLLAQYSHTLIKLHQSAKAIQKLKPLVRHYKGHPQLWNLLAEAYTQQNMRFHAYMARSTYLKTLGDLEGANLQLKMAQKLTKLTPQERAQVESELAQNSKIAK